jgi:hypothetical protein
MIFCIRDRASGWYLTHNPMRRETGGFELIKSKVFALPLLAEGRDAEKQAQKCCDVAAELFGENKRNGFELVWEPWGASDVR